MANECKIKCYARQGVFDDESVVRIPTVDSKGQDSEAQCLAYGNSVERQSEPNDSGEAEATLRVGCLSQNDDFAAVVLPQSTFQNGPNVIVRKASIVD